MLEELFTLAFAWWPLLLLLVTVLWLVRNKYGYGIHEYPGPLAASFTDWWRTWDVYRGTPERTHMQLHQKHGDVVRVGPNLLSFADPQALKDIYGLDKPFIKSDYYLSPMATANGRRVPSLFSSVDESYHAKLKRCVNNAFAMSTLVSFEPLVDSTILTFVDQINRRFVQTGRVCNLPDWLLYFASDVIGEITWSKRLGFLEKGGDVDQILSANKYFMKYAVVTGQNPPLDYLLLEKNPLKMWCARNGLWPNSGSAAVDFALARARERQDEKVLEDIEKRTDDVTTEEGRPRSVDFHMRFKKAQRDHPDFMDDHRILAASLSLIFAGSDSTAVSLSAILYFLMRNPICYRKVMTELNSAMANGSLKPNEAGVIAWSDARPDAKKLPYLHACIWETFRMHPAAGIILERVLPPEGAVIAGRKIPGGTIVGCNAWVIHRTEEIFGQDADIFRPERWIDVKEEDLKEMNAAMFQFGAGRRTCIGKNISLLEIYKFIPTILSKFKFEFANREPDIIDTTNRFFVTFDDLKVVIRSCNDANAHNDTQ